MKKSNWKKIRALQDAISAGVEEMRTIHEEEQSAWDDKSERWQEGDAGTEQSEKLDELDTLITDLEALTFPEET